MTHENVEPSKTTLSNYAALLEDTDGVSITGTVIFKTNTRYIEENSLTPAMALACVMVNPL